MSAGTRMANSPADGFGYTVSWLRSKAAMPAVAASHATDYPGLVHADFVVGNGRELWLKGTITRWLSTADLATCPTCGPSFATSIFVRGACAP